MDLLLSDPYKYLDTFFMIVVRISGLFILVPIFSNRNIPMMVKVCLVFCLSIIVLNLGNVYSPVSSTNVVEYAGLLVKELFVGWMIGLGAYFVYSILNLAGQFIDQQIGFSMVNVFDPMSQVQLSITGSLYYYLVITLTLVTNAHHYFIKAIVRSFDIIPIGDVAFTPFLYNSVVYFMNDFFLIALQIAAPVFLVVLVADIILGILARTAPQLNLFVIGFPLKILLGLAVLMVTLNVFSTVNDLITDNTRSLIEKIIKGMMP